MNYTQYQAYLFYRSGLQGIPLSGTFELTSRCNLDCRMCYIHKRSQDAEAMEKELTADEWLRIAGAARDRGMLYVLLTGGEPLVRKDFRRIYSACRKLGLFVSVNTNGTAITEDTADFFAEEPPLRVNLTLYGASPETYSAVCGDASAYDRAYRAVELLLARGIRLKVNFSATPMNAADMPRVFAFCRERGIPVQTASYMFPPVRACEGCQAEQLFRLDAADAGRVRFAYDAYRFGEEALRERARYALEGESLPDPDHECGDQPTERIRCRAGATTFWITCDGQMRPCGMMTVPTVDVRYGSFDDAWAYIRRERETIMLPARCTDCKWKRTCEFCPAVCYAENGAFDKTPSYMCRMTEAYLDCCRACTAEKNGGDAHEGQ